MFLFFNEGFVMISKTPKWIAPYVQRTDTFVYNGEHSQYLVVDPEFARVQGAPEVFTICKNGVLAISSAYPAEWHEIGLIHELVEQSLPQNDSVCLEALKVELDYASLSNIDIVSYKTFRIKFFENLITFYTNCDEFDERADLVKRLSHSLAYLKH